jgi:hypothetical protein
MKINMKKVLLLMCMTIFTCLIHAQRIDKQQIFVAISEEDVYKLYDQMLARARVSDWDIIQKDDFFLIDYFKEIDSKDTILKIIQDCDWKGNGDYICGRFYWPYISNCMPIAFYERFLKYLKDVGKRENYFIKDYSTDPLIFIKNILIKRCESGELNKQDSLKARHLIEQTILRLIKDAHNYRFLYGNDKYLTDKIRQALVNVIENPYYPTEYLDFYMSRQDTSCLDTTGIPPDIRPVWKVQFTPEELQVYEKEYPLYDRLQTFLIYEKKGKEKYNGLSAGQAYLQEKKDKFKEKGYVDINVIAEYAYKKQDKLLIKHLKAFKKKHPDYPLKYF